MIHSPQELPPTGSFAFVFRFSLARNAKTEAINFPGPHVIPTEQGLQPNRRPVDGHAAALCMEALRKIDPEIGEMLTTQFGDPAFSVYEEPTALRKPPRGKMA
jgi:hypothetical protein